MQDFECRAVVQGLGLGVEVHDFGLEFRICTDFLGRYRAIQGGLRLRVSGFRASGLTICGWCSRV